MVFNISYMLTCVSLYHYIWMCTSTMWSKRENNKYLFMPRWFKQHIDILVHSPDVYPKFFHSFFLLFYFKENSLNFSFSFSTFLCISRKFVSLKFLMLNGYIPFLLFPTLLFDPSSDLSTANTILLLNWITFHLLPSFVFKVYLYYALEGIGAPEQGHKDDMRERRRKINNFACSSLMIWLIRDWAQTCFSISPHFLSLHIGFIFIWLFHSIMFWIENS